MIAYRQCTECGTRIEDTDTQGELTDTCLCLSCCLRRLENREAEVRGLTAVQNACVSMLCKALGYTHPECDPNLFSLVACLCGDYAEKTRLLERVDQYLDKLDALNKERRETSNQQRPLFAELLNPENNPDCSADLENLFNWGDN